MRETMKKLHWSVALVAMIAAQALAAEEAKKPNVTHAPPEAVARWRDMKFGMFIHWGPVSLKGHEIGWSRGYSIPIQEYDSLYKKFRAEKFDPDQWAKIARDAGMKYLIFTTKHHDGFCMFDTKQTDFNVMHSPLGRDVTKELAQACRRAGLAFGTYHSVCDWHNPDFTFTSPGGKTQNPNPNMDRYEQYIRNQTEELIRNCGPLLTMWFDVPQDFGGIRGARLVEHCRRLQPDILVNNRSGNPDAGDHETPEQVVGRQQTKPWESCITICQQWAWKPNDKLKSLEECLHVLVNVVGGDGNLLLNVGPTPDGEIEPRQAERLREMGQWLQKYGASIYGTRGGPFPRGDWGAATCKGDTIYLHVLDPKLDVLKLPPLKQKIVSAHLFDGGAVEFRQSEQAIEIPLPKNGRQPIDTIIVVKLDGPAFHAIK
jgi:alpha-L-fucosidase